MPKKKRARRTEAEQRQTEYDVLSLDDKVNKALESRGSSKKQLSKLGRQADESGRRLKIKRATRDTDANEA